MREALPNPTDRRTPVAEHLGLAYDVYAPTGPDGKVPDPQRPNWLTRLGRTRVPRNYADAYRRWLDSFRQDGSRVLEGRASSRLLIGHGNPSATDVGLSLHWTWGVPFIPGSAIKGLVAHYVETTYGPREPRGHPDDAEGEERERARFQGVTWKNNSIAHGPGEVYRILFGAPDADSDAQHPGSGARSGCVVFHDALWNPGEHGDRLPIAQDVLTVHQRQYYTSRGETPPNDYDAPNPVTFLSVEAGAVFAFPLSGPQDWTNLAAHFLREALAEWGVGGKTSSGYGRFLGLREIVRPSNPLLNQNKALIDFRERLERAREMRWSVRALCERIGKSDAVAKLQACEEPVRQAAVELLRAEVRSHYGGRQPRIAREALNRLCDAIRAGEQGHVD